MRETSAVCNDLVKEWAVCILMCRVLMFSPLSLSAQEERRDSLSPNGTALRAVEVNADAKKWESGAEASQTITTEDIDKQGITDLAEALRRMAGANVRDYGGAGGMKTLSVRSMGATHTGVVYDGLPVTDCESGQIDLSRFSLEQLESITLVTGGDAGIFLPARTMASAATLIMTSGAPHFDMRSTNFSARVAAGSFGYVNPRFKIEQKLNDNWSVRVQGSFLRADNQYEFTLTNYSVVTKEKRNNNNLKEGSAEADLYYRPTATRLLHVKAYYYDNRKELPGQVIYYNPVNNECQRFRNVFGQVHYQTDLSQRISFQVNAKADLGITRYRDFALEYEDGTKRNYYKQQEYYVSASLLYTPLQGLSLSASTDYACTVLRSDAIGILRPMRHAFLESIAARYRKGDFTATATLIFSRYNNTAKEGDAARDAHRFSPSAALAWQPHAARWLSLRLSYKDIFRMPTFSDNYYAQMGSRNLIPEKAKQVNGGITLSMRPWRAVRKIELNADGYYNKVSDKIVAMPVNMFYWSMVNVGEVKIKGADLRLSLAFCLTKNISIEADGNYSYQYAVNVTDSESKYYKDQIAYTPRHSGGFSAALITPWLNVSFHGTAMSERWSTNQNMDITRISPHHEYGLAAYRDFRWRTTLCSLRADVLNITNEQYDIVRRYPMPGRSYKLSLKFSI